MVLRYVIALTVFVKDNEAMAFAWFDEAHVLLILVVSILNLFAVCLAEPNEGTTLVGCVPCSYLLNVSGPKPLECLEDPIVVDLLITILLVLTVQDHLEVSVISILRSIVIQGLQGPEKDLRDVQGLWFQMEK